MLNIEDLNEILGEGVENPGSFLRTFWLLALADIFLFVLFFKPVIDIFLSFWTAIDLVIFTSIIAALWALHIPVHMEIRATNIRGTPTIIDTMMELCSVFILAVLPFAGPFMPLLAYTIGAGIYYWCRRDIPERPKWIGVVFNTFSYGIAFLAVLYIVPLVFGVQTLNISQPFWLLIQLALILLVQTILIVLLSAYYYAASYNVPFKAKLRERIKWENIFVEALSILVFPGFAYIAIVFWDAHFYLDALLLIIPFVLFRRAMLGLAKIGKEIVNTIEAIVTLIEAKDPYTHHHCNRVALYAMVIAKFCGLPDALIEKIGNAARLHDVGKILLLDRVLKKEGGLSPEEYAHTKGHSDPKKILMNQIPDGLPLKELADLGRHHHERWDGKGYPDGLQENAIPIETRIIAMADAWDTMLSKRSYKDPYPIERVLSELDKYKGKQWDPLVVEACLEAHNQGAMEAVIQNPDLVNHPPASWKITPKALKQTPPPVSRSGQAEQKRQPDADKLKSSWRVAIFTIVSIAFFTALYEVPSSLLYQNAVVLFVALSSLLECWEVRLAKPPWIYPSEAVYLALLFILPIQEIILVIAFGYFVHLLYTYPGRNGDFQPALLLRRLLLFSMSGFFFRVLGLQSGGAIAVSAEQFRGFSSLLLLLYLIAWGCLYAFVSFFLEYLWVFLRSGFWRSSIRWRYLQQTMVSEAGIIAPLGFSFMALYVVFPADVALRLLAFALVLGSSYFLFNYYLQAVQANPRTLEALAEEADNRVLGEEPNKSPFFKDHSKRVAPLCRKIAIKMGMFDEETETLERAARVYRLGNVGIPDSILAKPAQMTEEETLILHQGQEKTIHIISESPGYKEELEIIAGHSKTFLGGNCQRNLKNQKLLLGSRILAVADAYIAMTSPRPYRPAMPTEQAIEKIRRNAEAQFDPEVIDAFLKVKEWP